ncbi:MAG: endonuclease Q family protein, partial [Candidatus Aenigmatarchaeota archaeon]
RDVMITSSHIWTPWRSILGSKSGFNSIEECYQDQTKNIFSLETGLSSDPSMNWRLSSLDKFTLVSNSDSHSPHPWRLGREANVFDLEKVTYWKILDATKKKDKKSFLYTIEVDPNYGKYHFDGHRNCSISLHPKDAIKLNNICPKCKRKLTIGVLHRVEELADRPEGFIPKDAIPFKTLLPLYEIISFAWGSGELYSKKVLEEHDKLIEKFGNELNVLLNVPKEELLKVTNEKIADAIIKVREGRVKYIPGYDGVYGSPVFDERFEIKKEKFHVQKNLKQF